MYKQKYQDAISLLNSRIFTLLNTVKTIRKYEPNLNQLY